MALQLCQQVMVLCAQKQCKDVAEICSFISTLCQKSEGDACREEAMFCAARAKSCEEGNCVDARRACNRARTICLKNYEIRGS